MKKLLVILLCVFALSACSSNSALVSDQNTAVITGDGVNYTKQDFFEDMKNNDYTNTITMALYNDLAELEGLDEASIEASIEDEINSLKEEYGDDYETAVNYYGGEDVIRDSIRLSSIIDELNNAYFSENEESLLEEYKPVMGKAIYFDDAETASNMYSLLEEGTSFLDAAKEVGYEDEITQEVITDKSDLPFEVKEYFNTATSTGHSSVLMSTTTATDADGNSYDTYRYYICAIDDLDVNNFKDEFYSTLSEDYDSDTIINSYLSKHNVEVYDQRTYDLVHAVYEAFE